MNTIYVAYLRVSKEDKDRKDKALERWGIKAQLFDIHRAFGKENCVKVFYEIESRSNEDRGELNKALAFCKLNGYGLRTAYIDRLGVGIHVMTLCEKSGVNIRFADNPTADDITIGIQALMSSSYVKSISIKQKAAADQRRKAGHQMGNPKNLTDYSRQQSATSRHETAKTGHASVYPLIKLMRKHLKWTLRQTADYLNDNGYTTSQGMQYSHTTIGRIEAMYNLSTQSN